jgi:hypothetical protein
MTDRPASWRMPTPKQTAKLAAAAACSRACATRPVGPADEMPPEYWQAVLADAVADTRPTGSLIQKQRLCDIQKHVLRVPVTDAAAPSRSRKPMPSGWPVPRLSGRVSDSGCWTIHVSDVPAATKRTAAGLRSSSHRPPRRSALSESWMPEWRRSTTPRPCQAATAKP